MLITHKQTGRQVDVTEDELKAISNNSHIAGLYNIPKIEEGKKTGKPLLKKPEKVELPAPSSVEEPNEPTE